MARGRKPKLPTPGIPGPDVVPGLLRERGACADTAAFDIFDAAMEGQRLTEAREYCAGCRVVAQCLEYALGNEPLGIWGGKSPAERELLRVEAAVFGPDDRFRSAELRAEVRGGRAREHIAHDRGVSLRTLERWIKQDGEGLSAA